MQLPVLHDALFDALLSEYCCRSSGGMEKKMKDDIAPPAKPNIMTNPVR